jgi:DNA topoisomerase-1
MAKQTAAKTKKKRAPRPTGGASPDAASAPGTGRPGRHLVIVESPAKAITIGRFLGRDYTVKASMGHVRDLPEGKLGVDPEQSFHAEYRIMKDKKNIVAEIKKAGQAADSVYLATDPDREGEAISWHLLEAAGWKDKPVRRVVFHSITPEAIKEAFENDREIDMRLVNAQQARRILDRLVGYQLSPLLWRKVQRGLSAGRVQSVALRLVVERDASIDAFVPVEYWTLDAALQPGSGSRFNGRLHSLSGVKEKLALPDSTSVDKITADLEGASYQVASVTNREIKRRPSPPFITSTLQQESWRQLRFSARKTMNVAQQLYEGIDIGGSDGTVGLITYMRTDSPQADAGAITETREYALSKWGKEYIPSTPRKYTTKSKVAQEAHEAIRPTSTSRDPAAMRGYLSSDQHRLYDLVWKRMVASQMADAVLDSTQVEIGAPGRSGQTYTFRVTGSVVKFPGFRVLYMEARDEQAEGEDSEEDDEERTLPRLEKGQVLTCNGLDPQQHHTQPPPRYTEASLIKSLEERGIGRPSTYAPTISTIVDRQYVNRERGTLKSTRLGQVVCEQLTTHFANIMDPDFTAQLEEQLDDVANGKQEWVPLLRDFYSPFSEALNRAHEEMPRIRVEEPTDEICDKCGSPMVIKHGRFGPFMSCSGFPDCRNSKPILKKTGAHCPQCGGDLVERKGKGRTFFGCTNYPECNFTVSQRPLAVACPECEGLLVTARNNEAKCTNCAYLGAIPEEEAVGAA